MHGSRIEGRATGSTQTGLGMMPGTGTRVVGRVSGGHMTAGMRMDGEGIFTIRADGQGMMLAHGVPGHQDWRAHGGLRPGPHASPRAEQGTGESVMPAVRDGPHPSSLERGRGGIEPSGENGAPSGRQQQGGGRDEVHGVGEAEGREEEKGSEGEEVFASLWEEGGEWSINARIQRLMSIVEIVPGREKEAVCGKLWGRVGGREKQTVVNGVVRQSGINTTNARSAKNRNIFGVPVNC